MRSQMVGCVLLLVTACGHGPDDDRFRDRFTTSSDGGTGTDGGTDGGSITVKRVFITSGTYDADFKTLGGGVDGLDGADKLCTTLALGAGYGGAFKAWLSSATVNAIDRLSDVGAWYQVKANGQTVKTFNNKSNLAGTPLAIIEYTELGNIAGGGCIWTGTETGGLRSTNTCTGFTSNNAGGSGSAGYQTTSLWTASPSCGSTTCDTKLHLYCLEQ